MFAPLISTPACRARAINSILAYVSLALHSRCPRSRPSSRRGVMIIVLSHSCQVALLSIRAISRKAKTPPQHSSELATVRNRSKLHLLRRTTAHSLPISQLAPRSRVISLVIPIPCQLTKVQKRLSRRPSRICMSRFKIMAWLTNLQPKSSISTKLSPLPPSSSARWGVAARVKIVTRSSGRLPRFFTSVCARTKCLART